MTEDEMVGWHHQLNGHEFEQALGDGEGQGRLVYHSARGCKESDMTEQLNNSVVPCVCTCMLSYFRLFGTPWTLSRQAPLSMEFSSQEYWSGLPFPTPRDPPSPGIKPESLASPALAGRFFTTAPPEKPIKWFQDTLSTWVLAPGG